MERVLRAECPDGKWKPQYGDSINLFTYESSQRRNCSRHLDSVSYYAGNIWLASISDSPLSIDHMAITALPTRISKYYSIHPLIFTSMQTKHSRKWTKSWGLNVPTLNQQPRVLAEWLLDYTRRLSIWRPSFRDRFYLVLRNNYTRLHDPETVLTRSHRSRVNFKYSLSLSPHHSAKWLCS